MNNEAIHRHFHDLTTGVLQPLHFLLEPGEDGFLPVWEPESFLAGLRASQVASVPAVVMDRWVPAVVVDKLVLGARVLPGRSKGQPGGLGACYGDGQVGARCGD